ncbi:MAG: zraR [Bacteroidetes bacterium]|jgi:DNA-binding NtrC family response regulator|nr:zraR [Bacteroidota bacterium]
MQNLENYYNLFVAADNELYARSLKQSLESTLDKHVKVEAFISKEECINKIQKDNKPDIVVLDYKLNKKTSEGQNSYTVDKIKEISPETIVIMMSNEEDMPSAIKALRYGAYDYVMKDRFAFSHIREAVEKCLVPSRC